MVFDILGAHNMLETRTISPSPIMAFEEATLYPEEYAEIQAEQSYHVAVEMGLVDDGSQKEAGE